jgi:hypothetical protein
MIVNNDNELYLTLPAEPGEAHRLGELQAIRDLNRLTHEKGTMIEEFLTSSGLSNDATVEQIERWLAGDNNNRK